MKRQTSIPLRPSNHLLLIVLALGCVALSPAVQAEVPQPPPGKPFSPTPTPSPTATPSEDRGNSNSAAEGVDALNPATTGANNTAHGWFSLFSNTTGSFNTADGYSALYSNTSGPFNTAIGNFALYSNTEGDRNTAMGESALLNNTTGAQNVAVGVSAMRNSNGFGNIAIGQDACRDNGAASGNTGVGYLALSLNTANDTTAFGNQALANNITGQRNLANGAFALYNNTTGGGNTAVGYAALFNNTSAGEDTTGANTAVGRSALASATTSGSNTAIGYAALFSLTESPGGANSALGDVAGADITGIGNVCIGAGVRGTLGDNNATRIRNIGSTPIVGGTNVVISGTGGNGDQILGYASSSRRYKEAISPMGKASETLFALKPVTFRGKTKTDAADVKYYGLIAEDVAAVDPDLVVYNPEGKPETLRFDSINAMLLNEFLKEHKKVQELENTVANLAVTVKDQAAQIQKVSARIEISRPTPQIVRNRD